MKIKVHTSSIGHYLSVRINGKQVQTVNPRTKNWPKHNSNPQNCKGRGQSRCIEQGAHSWFNHSMDGVNPHKNLPPNVLTQPNLYRDLM